MQGGSFDESARTFLLLKKRFNLGTHGWIGSTFFIEKRRSFIGSAFDSGLN